MVPGRVRACLHALYACVCLWPPRIAGIGCSCLAVKMNGDLGVWARVRECKMWAGLPLGMRACLCLALLAVALATPFSLIPHGSKAGDRRVTVHKPCDASGPAPLSNEATAGSASGGRRMTTVATCPLPQRDIDGSVRYSGCSFIATPHGVVEPGCVAQQDVDLVRSVPLLCARVPSVLVFKCSMLYSCSCGSAGRAPALLVMLFSKRRFPCHPLPLRLIPMTSPASPPCMTSLFCFFLHHCKTVLGTRRVLSVSHSVSMIRGSVPALTR